MQHHKQIFGVNPFVKWPNNSLKTKQQLNGEK